MNEDMVMRSVYLRPSQDGSLRQLAHEHHVSKSDLIRSAISAKLEEWIADPTSKLILKDLELGRRTPAATPVEPEPIAQAPRAPAPRQKQKKAAAPTGGRPARPSIRQAKAPENSAAARSRQVAESVLELTE